MGAKRFHQVNIPASVETVILLADNDAEGRRARDRAAESYRRRPAVSRHPEECQAELDESSFV
jgi:5S rRNA maturation endonuclease (ribonuclease M5)